MTINSVGVIGSGLMGSGIAQVAAQAGCQVRVRDTATGQLQKGRASIEKSTAKLVEKGKLLASDRDAALSRLEFTTEQPPEPTHILSLSVNL